MNRLIVYTWSDASDPNYFLQTLESNVNTAVIILGPEESWIKVPPYHKDITDFWNKIDSILVNNNNTLDILIGTNDYKSKLISSKVNVHCWPTGWLSSSYQRFHEYNTQFVQELVDIKYPFVSMINVPRRHRCCLMDELSRLNLISMGSISWNMLVSEIYGYVYPWKFWEETILHVDDFYNKNKKDQYTVPEAYKKSFIDLVSETSVDQIFLTEKTARPLFHKKPFIVQGAANFHKYLTTLGFILYDEIIDYSFDQEVDSEIRSRMIVQEIEKIAKNGNYNDLRKKIHEKIEFNYSKFCSIALDKTLLPKILLDNLVAGDRYTHRITEMYSV